MTKGLEVTSTSPAKAQPAGHSGGADPRRPRQGSARAFVTIIIRGHASTPTGVNDRRQRPLDKYGAKRAESSEIPRDCAVGRAAVKGVKFWAGTAKFGDHIVTKSSLLSIQGKEAAAETIA